MRRTFRLLLLLSLLFAPAMAAAQDGGDFTITGVTVDTAAPSAVSARMAGWRVAQRKAWPMLYSRLTGSTAGLAPRLSDSTLDSIVSGIEVEREQIGPKRYIARLAVVFDRARASSYLGASARLLRSAPMLLMPVEISGGTRTVYERRGDWAQAWARFRMDSSPIAYVRAAGTGGDALILNAYQAYRPNRDLWRAALARYSAANVLVAEARLTPAWPGGPVTGRFRALAGPDNRVLDAFELRAATPDELTKMLDIAVARIDLKFTEALRDGSLRAEEDLLVSLDDMGLPMIGGGGYEFADYGTPLLSIEVLVNTPDEDAILGYEAAVTGTPGVASAALVEPQPGGISRLRIDFRGSFERLRYDLDQAGLRLEPEGGGYRMRQRLQGEALLPPPAETLASAAPAGAGAEDVVVSETPGEGGTLPGETPPAEAVEPLPRVLRPEEPAPPAPPVP